MTKFKIYFFIMIFSCFFILELISSFLYPNIHWYMIDDLIGWKHHPHLDELFYGLDFKSRIQTNSEGFVDVEHSIEKNKKRIVVLGDSFVESFQTDYDKNFVKLLEQKLDNYETFNFGVSSFGTDNEYLTYFHYSAKYSPDIVILTFTNNDVRDNYEPLYQQNPKIELMKYKPFFEIAQNGTLIKKDFEPYKKPVVKSILGKSQFLSFLNNIRHIRELKQEYLPEGYKVYAERYDENWNTAWNITFKLIQQLKKQVENTGAEFILLIGVDDIQLAKTKQDDLKNQYTEAQNITFNFEKPTIILQEFCKKQNINCITLHEHFKNNNPEQLFVQDGHWNTKGHELVAKVLYEHFQKT